MNAYCHIEDKSVPNILMRIANQYENLGLEERVVSIYKLIASSYKASQNYDSAHFYCDKSIFICKNYNVASEMLPALYQLKGVLYYNGGNYEDAKTFFLRSLKLYNETNQQGRSIYALDYLHDIFVKENNYVKAYFYLKKYQYLIKKKSSEEKINLAKVLEINNKVVLLHEQLAKLKANELFFYLVILFFVVIIVGFIVYFRHYQKRKKQMVDGLNKEFHNLLMGIGEKQLLENRLTLHNHKKVEIEFEKNQILDGNLGQSFDNCYMETINMFKESFPTLTKTEVRYAVMLCLKLPVEIIAKVQNVQPSSIRKAKQRIRTKLEVSDNLEQYLQDYREKQISNISR